MTVHAYEMEWEGYSGDGGVFGMKTQVLATCEEDARRELIHEMLEWGAQVRRITSVRWLGTMTEGK